MRRGFIGQGREVTGKLDRQGFGFSLGNVRLDIQTLCLQIEPPPGRDILTDEVPTPTLIGTTELKYHKQDYNFSLSFFLLYFSRLFQV